MIYIGIIGSRRRNTPADCSMVDTALLTLRAKYNGESITIVSGGCPKGGDRFAEVLAANYGMSTLIHLPNLTGPEFTKLFQLNPRLAHTKANYARNTLIARDSQHGLIACVAPDRKGGTEHTIKEFKKLHPKGELILC